MAQWGLDASTINEMMIEESAWDGKSTSWRSCGMHADNFVIVCSIENFDPMGISYRRQHHRGAGPDPDRCEYQDMRDAAKQLSPESALTPGGPNIQFAV